MTAACLAASAPVRAQLPSASAAALGMGDNYMTSARGFNAVAWNPANLGLVGNPKFSIAILPIKSSYGLRPITLGDVKGYESEIIPGPVKETWLKEIEGEGGEE